jgi:hypothetical protein
MSRELLVERDDFELFLPRPERARDEVDALAVCKHSCPVCFARPSSGCSWAVFRSQPSWCAHGARRALVDDIDWLMKRAAVVGRDVDRALLALELRGLRRFGFIRRR